MKKVINTKKDAINYMKGVYFNWPAFFKQHTLMRTSFEIIFEDDRKKSKKCINLNDLIKVKLNDYGRAIYYHQYDEFIEMGLDIGAGYPETDKDGYSTFQLWYFISIYGKYLSMAQKLPLEDLNIYIVDEEEKQKG